MNRSIDTIVPDFNKCVGKSRQKRSEVNKSPTSSTTEDASTSTTPPKSKRSKVPTDDVNNVPNKATKTPEKKPSQYQDEATVELDIQLRELLREKEIVSNIIVKTIIIHFLTFSVSFKLNIVKHLLVAEMLW
jgi:hypothetical protein